MIYFFGTRASKIKERKLTKTVCPYCSTPDSFVVRTFGKYFHFFWIPIVPLLKTNIAQCSHCKKSYALHEFSPEMERALNRENEINPAKRPLWQGCGCLVLIVFFVIVMSLSFYGVYLRSQGAETTTIDSDPRMELLTKDMAKMTHLLQRDKNAISFVLKECLDYDIVGGLDTSEISYLSSLRGNKLLVLLQIENIKKVKPEFRKDILRVVEDCLQQQAALKEINEVYIGIEGKWNTVLVKTPTESDLGARFANKAKLLSFYGEESSFIKAKTDSILQE